MLILGLVTGFLGATLQGFGVLFQKRAQKDDTGYRTSPEALGGDNEGEEDSTDDDDLAYVKKPAWRIGFAVFLTGSILCFIAVGSIGPSLLVIISSISLLVNVMFSPSILKEARRCMDWASVLLIICGISLAITGIQLSGHKERSIEETNACIQSRTAISAWVTLLFCFLGATLLCRLKGKEPENKYIRACFAVRAGLSGVLGVMLATPTSALIQYPTPDYPLLWIIAAALIAQVVLDIHIQNRSLKFNGGLF